MVVWGFSGVVLIGKVYRKTGARSAAAGVARPGAPWVNVRAQEARVSAPKPSLAGASV